MKDLFVLDASALLSIVLDEHGYQRVEEVLDASRIHAVNLAEAISRLVRPGMQAEAAGALLGELQIAVEEEFGPRHAEFCGALLGTRRDLGLSLGDAICLTAAAWAKGVALTADRRWKELGGAVLSGQTIRVASIR